MKTNQERIAHTYPPRIERKTAITLLHKAVIEAGQVAINYEADDSEGAAPCHVEAAEAGLGKSTATLTEIAKQLSANPARRILYMVPSLDLGEELAAKAKALGIDARLMRGRSQKQPNSTETMCAKSELADQIAAVQGNVSQSLCRKENEDGTISECPFYAQCAYIKQMEEAKKGGLIIASHQYLSVRMEALKEIDWLIIDESFWQVLCADRRIDLGRFTTFRGVGDGFRGRKGEDRAEFEQRQAGASESMIDGIARFANVIDRAEDANRQPTLADFIGEGFTADECAALATLEFSRITPPDITPSMDYEEQKDRLQKAHVQEAFGFVRIWKILAAELASGRTGEPHGLVIERGILNPKSNELGNFIHAYWSRDPLFKSVPTLILDADADEEIIRRFYPHATYRKTAVEWKNVRIRQITDKTGSAQSLKGDRRRDEAYNTALDIADRLTAAISGKPERRPLLVSQKAVIDSYREGGDLAAAPFDVGHFGNLRGKDQWKETAGVVIAGRIEPSPTAIESMARSIWFGSETPLSFLAPTEDGKFILPKCQHWTTARSGQSAEVAVSYHPDERADRVLRQVREAELMQAIARVRPIHRSAENPCEIIVLTNVPLPVQAHEFWTWAEMVPDRHDMMRLSGFIPEKATDAADAFPSIWSSANAVRVASHRRTERANPSFEGHFKTHIDYYMGGETPPSSWVRVSYERPAKSGTRAGAAWVRLEVGDTLATVSERVSAFLADAYDFDALLPETAPASAPEAADRRQTRDDKTGFRIVSRQTIMLAQSISADEMPWWSFMPRNRSRIVNKNSMTNRCC